MSNPYLPKWEYIPDGEPRVFGDRIYIYGSHDKAGSAEFCDFVLKCWSAPIDNLNEWVCHGDIFHTRADRDHECDIDWNAENTKLFAPDVVEKDGKYYLYAYIVNGRGCVAVADRPEGPFKLLSQYKTTIDEEITCNGWFIDPGVLVDDDGKVYVYCGYQRSFLAEINPDNMYEVLPGSCVEHFIPSALPGSGERGELALKEPQPDGTPAYQYSAEEGPQGFDEHDKLFFEACSPRKVGDTYYMIYSPLRGSRLAYATSKSPTGPFTYRGFIVDNGVDYTGGNDHGSIMKIKDQWYIFYHRMTNGTIMSRRGCVEKITILPDGTIPTVEMTSLGFEDSLNPYQITDAEIACVLKGGALITERNEFERIITGIKAGCVMGYKYFDFGEDFSSKTMEFSAQIDGCGCDCTLHIMIDAEDGEEIGSCKIGHDSGVIRTIVKNVTGRHAVFFKVTTDYPDGWFGTLFENRNLFDFKRFVFMK